MATRRWRSRSPRTVAGSRTRERAHRRALDDLAGGGEARAVAGAVPGALGGVPVHDAAEVRAARGQLVQRAVLVAIGGSLTESRADDTPLPRCDLVDAAALDQAVADEAQRHVRVLLHERGHARLRPQPLRVEEWG